MSDPHTDTRGESTRQFEDEVFPSELEEIERRRRRLDLPATSTLAGLAGPSVHRGLAGLAISGGGIRSATFALGALQRLAADGWLRRFDYLSTVSGGGYIGTAVTSMLGAGQPADAKEDFPFARPPHRDTERPAMLHVRRYANYLFAGGVGRMRVLLMLMRGLVVNLFLTLPPMLAAVALTQLSYKLLGSTIAFTAQIFLLGSLMALGAMVLHPIVLRLGAQRFDWRRRERFERTVSGLASLLLLPVVAWPLLTAAHWAAAHSWQDFGDIWARHGDSIYATVSAFAGSLGAGGVAVMATQSRQLRALMDRIALMISGVLLPVAAILIYLAMCLTVIHIHTTRMQVAPEALTLEQAQAALREAGEDDAASLRYERAMPCVGQRWLVSLRPRLGRPCWHAFDEQGRSWTIYTEAQNRVAVVGDGGFESWHELGWLALAALLLFFNRALIDINHTAIHGFYRDRLSRAFLLRPGTATTVEHADGLHLHEMNASGVAPYHLYNVALNLSGSLSAQARDRGADFFILSKRYCGGPATGWVATERLEDLHPHLDVGTAMAISGAAAAPNMGGYTRSQLSPLMALLNFRLGYWLPNPVHARSDEWTHRLQLRMGVPPRYLLHEALSRTDARHPFVNLSDGGHIENMGVYELLRRRCAVIVMIDGEADAASNFPGLTALERLARIDLGVEIQFNPAMLATGPDGLAQAHVQTGSYRYANGESGLLIYLRANLTGDEAHSVLSYRRRSPSFPHESTADQFFTEEQFEAYRALGEHAAADVALHLEPATLDAPTKPTAPQQPLQWSHLDLVA